MKRAIVIGLVVWAVSPALWLFGQGLSVTREAGQEVIVKITYTAEQQKLATGFLLQSAPNISTVTWSDESTIAATLREFRFPATVPKFYRVIVLGTGTARSASSNVVSVQIVVVPVIAPAIIGVQ